MAEEYAGLSEVINRLEKYQDVSEEKLSAPTLLNEAAEEVAKSASGSWLGYHSRVYYRNFLPPEPGANFSKISGFRPHYGDGTTGDWAEYAFDDVLDYIDKIAESPDLSEAQSYKKEGEKLFAEAKQESEVCLRVFLSEVNDTYVESLLEELGAVKILPDDLFIKIAGPKGQFQSSDNLAISQGIQTPPHVSVAAKAFSFRLPHEAIGRLLPVLKKAYSYILRSRKKMVKDSLVGTNVFIGHGRSHVWRDLKDFVTERLKLPFDEFNRVPVAGITNIARLSEMLDSAVVAFIVMTAEDELADGKMEARTNVIHEVGLFQGRLGFTRAIVLLEEGCEEFSNIQGLGQIRFPKGDIKSRFEEIRQVLEREKIIES